MKEKMIQSLSILAGIFILINVSGCSMIGYGIGTAIDNSKEDYRTKEKWDTGTAKKGRKVRVTLQNGNVIKGRYRGLDNLDYSDYTKRCNDFRQQSSETATYPCPGDVLTIVTATDDSIVGKFLGYDINYRLDENDSSAFEVLNQPDLYRLTLTVTDDSSPSDLLLSGVKSLSIGNGESIQSDLLKDAAEDQKLPLRSAINVRIKWDKQQFPVDDIKSFEIDSAHNTRYYLLAVGLVLDAGMIALGIALSQMDIGLGGGRGGEY